MAKSEIPLKNEKSRTLNVEVIYPLDRITAPHPKITFSYAAFHQLIKIVDLSSEF